MNGNLGIAFEIEVNAPYSLNYLVFLQNIFLNSKENSLNRPLFPYLDSSTWGLLEEEKFTQAFNEVWNEVVRRNSASRLFDHNGILDIENPLFQRLFEPNDRGSLGFIESSKAFLAWWDGIAGRIAIEGVFDEDSMNKIYSELACSVQPTSDRGRLMIDLVYDKPIIGEHSQSPWHIVIPIEDIFLKGRRQEVIERLRRCCEIN